MRALHILFDSLIESFDWCRDHCRAWLLTGLLAGLTLGSAAPVTAEEAGWIQAQSEQRVTQSTLEELHFVNADALNFRPGPSLKTIPRSVLRGNDFVRRLDETFNHEEGILWYQVVRLDGLEGYAAAKYLTPVGEAVAIVDGAADFVARIDQAPILPVAKRFDQLKVGFVYPAPIADAGWTFQHDQGRQALEALPFVTKTSYVESVPEDPALVGEAIDRLVAEGHNLIFTTSYGYMDPTIDAAQRHQHVVFMHSAGF